MIGNILIGIFILALVLGTLFGTGIIKISKSSQTIFKSGTGGKASFNNVPGKFQNTCGGGGAGGLLINDQLPVKSATEGVNGLSGNPPSGLGGIGFGAGGGGAGFLINGSYSPIGGSGANGFVYIVEDKVLITTSQTYIAKKTTYKFIAMGGGGAGGLGGYLSTFCGNGGCSGNIINTSISVALNSVLTITIGQGGVCVQNTTVPTLSSSSPGGDTTIQNSDGTVLITAKGGLSGGDVNGPNILTSSCGSAIGGLGVPLSSSPSPIPPIANNGGIINISVIESINKFVYS